MRLYGKRSVSERIKANPASIRKVITQEGVDRSDVSRLARAKKIRIETLPRNRFLQFTQGMQTQGVLAEVQRFQYRDFEDIIAEKAKQALLFLDRITDPQNLGVILRNAACFGRFALVVPKHESVEVTETVLKVACGAENYVPVSLVTNLSSSIQKAKNQGYWIYAAVVGGGQNPGKNRLNFPIGLVLGSEGEGIRPGILKYVDQTLTLPMRGKNLSLNVAMAAGIFCYEVANQMFNDSPGNQESGT